MGVIHPSMWNAVNKLCIANYTTITFIQIVLVELLKKYFDYFVFTIAHYCSFKKYIVSLYFNFVYSKSTLV